MIVKMNTFLLWRGRSVRVGQDVDLPEVDALAFIRTGQASLVEQPQPEAATLAPPASNAMRHTQPQLKRR